MIYQVGQASIKYFDYGVIIPVVFHATSFLLMVEGVKAKDNDGTIKISRLRYENNIIMLSINQKRGF